MKKRKEKEVKTSTLISLLVLFLIIFSSILLPLIWTRITDLELMILLSIIAFVFAAFASFMTVSIIAILLKWRI